MSLEDRVSRLENLFNFGENGVSMTLSQGDNTVTLGALDNSAYLSVSGKNHLVGIHTEQSFGGFGTYHKQLGQEPVLYFFVDEEGKALCQHTSDGKVSIMPIDLNVQEQQQLTSTFVKVK